MIACMVTPGRIKLYDSYKVSKRDMLEELTSVREQTCGSEVWKRSMRSLLAEWTCHNFAYAVGYKRERTKDVDLNYPQKWYASAAYWLLGAVVWPFIK